MDTYMITLRIIHILSATFWTGGSFFMLLVVQPSVAAAGPAGGQVMQRMTKARLPILMMSSTILTLVSGILLYARDSGGFSRSWMESPTGTVFTIGALAGIAAFILGLVLHLPHAIRMRKLGDAIAASGGPPSPEQAQEIAHIQRKIGTAAIISSVLLLVALVAMASARYAGATLV